MGSEPTSVNKASQRSRSTPKRTTAKADGGQGVGAPRKDGTSATSNPSSKAKRAETRRRNPATKTPPAARFANSAESDAGSSSAVLGAAQEGSALSITPEIRALASGLADELFQRWELAMQQRFEEELKLRLKTELEHREHQAAVLREEVDQRARGAFGPGGTKVVGMADLYATWERDRKLINQSREVAEMERQMVEMRQRLRDLGADLAESTLTVDKKDRTDQGNGPRDSDPT